MMPILNRKPNGLCWCGSVQFARETLAEVDAEGQL
jgi:hypothetical protein